MENKQNEVVIEKNTQEIIRVGNTTFNGKNLVSIRVFLKTRDGYIPTKKGLTVRPDIAEKVCRALQGLVGLGVSQ